jgi:hypothetical protein
MKLNVCTVGIDLAKKIFHIPSDSYEITDAE